MRRKTVNTLNVHVRSMGEFTTIQKHGAILVRLVAVNMDKLSVQTLQMVMRIRRTAPTNVYVINTEKKCAPTRRYRNIVRI
jgi:hypothetical protein